MAFACWLDYRLQGPVGAQIRPLTEWEWQQAATGGIVDTDWLSDEAIAAETVIGRGRRPGTV
jgi:hypothetical protein